MVPGPDLKKYYMLALRPAKSLTHTSQGRIYFPGPKEKQLLVVCTFSSAHPTLAVYLMAGTEPGEHNR